MAQSATVALSSAQEAATTASLGRAGHAAISADNRPRPRNTARQTVLCSALIVDLLQLIIMPSLHQSRQLALRAGCPAVTVDVAAWPFAAMATPAVMADLPNTAPAATDTAATVIGGDGEGLGGPASWLASRDSPAPPPLQASRPALYIDAYDQWVVRHFPCNRGTLGRAAYTFSRLYPYAFATNAYLDMSEVLFAAALTLSVACALASRACAADGHEDECTGGSALQGGQPPPAADAAAWRQRRRRWRVAWQLRWAQAHRFFSISARQLMSVGNIWTLLLFRRRYGPSVGGMVVPLGSGKYFIAEHRLQQACPYYLLGSLLGAKVALPLHAALAALEWALLVASACCTDSLTHGSLQRPLLTAAAMAATAFAPVLIVHGPVACYRFALANLVQVPALRRLLHRVEISAAAQAGSAGGPADDSSGRSGWRRLWPQQSHKLPKAQPSPPPPHLAPPQSPRSPPSPPPVNLKQRRTSSSPASSASARRSPQQQQQQQQQHRRGSPSRASAEARAKLMGNGSCAGHRGAVDGWFSTSRSSTEGCCCGPPSYHTAAGGSVGADASTSDCTRGAPSRSPAQQVTRKGHNAQPGPTHGSPSPLQLPSPLNSPTSALEWRGSAPPVPPFNTGSVEERRIKKPPIRSPPDHFPRTRSLALSPDQVPPRTPTLDLVALLGQMSPSAATPASPASHSAAAAALRALCAALSSPGLSTQAACPETPISGAPARSSNAAVDASAAATQSGSALSPDECVLDTETSSTAEDRRDQGGGSGGPQTLKPPATTARARATLARSGAMAAAAPAVAPAAAPAAAAASRAATSDVPSFGSSPLYTSSNMSYFMSVKVHDHEGPFNRMSDPGAGGFPSTALAAVSAASLSALRSVNRTMSAAAAAGGGGGGVQRHVVGLGRCVVRGCVHLLQVVRVRRRNAGTAHGPGSGAALRRPAASPAAQVSKERTAAFTAVAGSPHSSDMAVHVCGGLGSPQHAPGSMSAASETTGGAVGPHVLLLHSELALTTPAARIPPARLPDMPLATYANRRPSREDQEVSLQQDLLQQQQDHELQAQQSFLHSLVDHMGSFGQGSPDPMSPPPSLRLSLPGPVGAPAANQWDRLMDRHLRGPAAAAASTSGSDFPRNCLSMDAGWGHHGHAIPTPTAAPGHSAAGSAAGGPPQAALPEPTHSSASIRTRTDGVEGGLETADHVQRLAQAATEVTSAQLHSWLTHLLQPVCASPPPPATVAATYGPFEGEFAVQSTEGAKALASAGAASPPMSAPLPCYPEVAAVHFGSGRRGENGGSGSRGPTTEVRLLLSPEAVAEAGAWPTGPRAVAQGGRVGQERQHGKTRSKDPQTQQGVPVGPTVRVVVSAPNSSTAWVDQEVAIELLPRGDSGVSGGGSSHGGSGLVDVGDGDVAAGGMLASAAEGPRSGGCPAGAVTFHLPPGPPSTARGAFTACGLHVYLLPPSAALDHAPDAPDAPPRRGVLCVVPLLLAADPRVAAEINGAFQDSVAAVRQAEGCRMYSDEDVSAAGAGAGVGTVVEGAGAVRQLSYDPYNQIAFDEHVAGLVADMAELLLPAAHTCQLAGAGEGVGAGAWGTEEEEEGAAAGAAAEEALEVSKTLLPYLAGRGMWECAALVVRQLQGRWGVAVRGAEGLEPVAAAAAGEVAAGEVAEVPPYGVGSIGRGQACEAGAITVPGRLARAADGGAASTPASQVDVVGSGSAGVAATGKAAESSRVSRAGQASASAASALAAGSTSCSSSNSNISSSCSSSNTAGGRAVRQRSLQLLPKGREPSHASTSTQPPPNRADTTSLCGTPRRGRYCGDILEGALEALEAWDAAAVADELAGVCAGGKAGSGKGGKAQPGAVELPRVQEGLEGGRGREGALHTPGSEAAGRAGGRSASIRTWAGSVVRWAGSRGGGGRGPEARATAAGSGQARGGGSGGGGAGHAPDHASTDTLVWVLLGLKHLLNTKHLSLAGMCPAAAAAALVVCIGPPLLLLLLRPHTYARHRTRVILLMYELPWELMLLLQAAWLLAVQQRGHYWRAWPERRTMHDVLRLVVTPGLFGIHPAAVAGLMACRAVPYGIGLVRIYGMPVAAAAMRVVLMLLSAVCTAALLRQLRSAGNRTGGGGSSGRSRMGLGRSGGSSIGDS